MTGSGNKGDAGREAARETPEEFLSRWSRRKHQARTEAQLPQPPAKNPAAQPEPPPLPPVENLTPESDFSGFLHPKVDEGLRRAALKKLFSDPHFNVMDGLDVYIDDYSVSEPIPDEMLKQLKHAKDIITSGKERREAAAKAEAEAEEAARLAAAEAAALPQADETTVASAPDAAADAVVPDQDHNNGNPRA